MPGDSLSCSLVEDGAHDWQEGSRRLKELQEYATAPQFCHWHKWTAGDTVCWDNRQVLHRSTPFVKKQSWRRVMWTVGTKGERALPFRPELVGPMVTPPEPEGDSWSTPAHARL